MNIEEARKNVGRRVMSTDPGRKMMRELPPHGPYRLTQVTKEGLAILQGRVAPTLRVAPRHLTLYEGPTHSTEETPYYYVHKPGDPLCECDFAQIWITWPLECRNCGRIVRSTQKAPLEEKVSIYVVTCNVDYEGASIEGAFLSWEAAERRRLSLWASGMSFQNYRVEEWKEGAHERTNPNPH